MGDATTMSYQKERGEQDVGQWAVNKCRERCGQRKARAEAKFLPSPSVHIGILGVHMTITSIARSRPTRNNSMRSKTRVRDEASRPRLFWDLAGMPEEVHGAALQLVFLTAAEIDRG